MGPLEQERGQVSAPGPGPVVFPLESAVWNSWPVWAFEILAKKSSRAALARVGVPRVWSPWAQTAVARLQPAAESAF
jgi:hypothetical protein